MVEHGGDRYSHSVTFDFSVNLNPLGIPERVLLAAQRAVEDSAFYPDPECRALRKALADFHSCSSEWLLCGNGAADLIYRLAAVFRGKRVLLPAPTFGEYEQAFSRFGCSVFFYPLKRENGFVLDDDFLDLIWDADCVLLCNPNNPTGRAVSRDTIGRILCRCRQAGAFLIVDECFLDFLDHPQQYDALPLVRQYDRLLLLRAFTKQYAMAGLRLGYCISGNVELLGEMKEFSQPWSVSLPAQAAGIAALTEREYLSKTREMVRDQREKMLISLKQVGLQIVPSQVNFILFRAAAPNLKQQLLQDGILIRSCRNYRGLDEYDYRIAVRTEQENRYLIEQMKRYLLR